MLSEVLDAAAGCADRMCIALLTVPCSTGFFADHQSRKTYGQTDICERDFVLNSTKLYR